MLQREVTCMVQLPPFSASTRPRAPQRTPTNTQQCPNTTQTMMEPDYWRVRGAAIQGASEVLSLWNSWRRRQAPYPNHTRLLVFRFPLTAGVLDLWQKRSRAPTPTRTYPALTSFSSRRCSLSILGVGGGNAETWRKGALYGKGGTSFAPAVPGCVRSFTALPAFFTRSARWAHICSPAKRISTGGLTRKAAVTC